MPHSHPAASSYMLSGKHGGALVDTFGSILNDTRRSRSEAIAMIAAIKAGTLGLAPGMTPDKALSILERNTADYDAIISRLGGRNHA